MSSFHAPVGLFAHAARITRLSIAAMVIGAVLSPASASPQGQQVVAGSVTFSHVGGTWVITASDGSIIQYSSFHINPNEVVQFVQPGQWAAVLNRITGAEPTLIMGTLLANGQVYFVNPAGVFFMPGSVVDVGGIYAAAGNISNADFLSGVNHFTDLNGWVVNQGTINADTVALVGKHVGNWGQINAPQGVIAMIAGDNVLLSQIDGHIMVQVDGHGITDQAVPHGGTTAPDLDVRPGVINAGQINAGSGQVVLGAGDMYALAILNSGSINAAGGDITVAATDGVIHNTGTIDVSVEDGQAGSITVQGPSVVNEGLIAADSDNGQAGDIEVTSQHHTYLLDGSVISASGGSGTADGGDIFVHSYDGLTVLADGAHIDASGGATGGQGGYAEVSGSQLIFNGTVDLSTSDGTHLGTLALDPDGIIIADTGTSDGLITPGGGVIDFIDASGAVITISDEALEAVIGHIVLHSFGDILVQHQVDLTGGPHDVTLHAEGDIVFDAAINGAHHLEVIADIDGDGVGDLTINVQLTQILGNGTFGGHEIHLNGSVISAQGTLIFNDAVILEADTQLTGSSISFLSTVDSAPLSQEQDSAAFDLTLFGGTTFHGDVGQAEDGALGDLTVFGSATIDTGHVTTLGLQDYHETVTIAESSILTAEQAHFFDTLEGGTFGGQDLEIHGDAIFDEVVGDIFERLLNNLLVTGDSQINGGAVNTVLNQTYNGAVTLGADTMLTSVNGGDIHFLSTVDSGCFFEYPCGSEGCFEGVAGKGGFPVCGVFDLLVNTAGTTIFEGIVGGIHQLDLLQTFAGGETQIGDDMFANGIDLFDSVRMIGDAELNGFDFVAFHSTIDGDGHDLTVNSPDTLFNAEVSDMGTLHTDAAGTTFVAADITGDTIQFDDSVLLVDPESIDDGGVASVFPPPPGPSTITITGDTLVEFGDTLDGNHHLIVNSGGDVHFNGAVGDDIALTSLSVEAADVIEINGGLVVTEFGQDYDGAVTLGDDTQLHSFLGGDIHFFSTVDSGCIQDECEYYGECEGHTSSSEGTEFCGPFDLLVFTSGTTSFDGVVGGVNQLDRLATFNGGETHIGDDMFANSLDFFDAVQLTGDAELTGFDQVLFNNTVDGDEHDLTVNSPQTFFIGEVSDMGTLHTDADGTTFIAADITGDILDFDDPIRLINPFILDDGGVAGDFGPSTIVITGASSVDFAQTIDGFHHLIVNSGGPAHFGGDVGSDDPLASFEFNVVGVTTIDGALIQAEGDILFNPDGHDDIPHIATVAAPSGGLQIISFDGDFLMGVNEKLTVLGDLLISAVNGSATVGDLSTLGDMIVLAQQIFLQAREPSTVLDFEGETQPDEGLDFVAGGSIIFSVVPILNGTGVVLFTTPDGGGISDTLAAFEHLPFGSVTASIFNFGSTVLDLAARRGGGGGGGGGGPIDTSNPVGSFAADVPLDSAHLVIGDDVYLDPTRREALRRMNLFVRDANAAELRDTINRRQLYNNSPTKFNPTVQDYEITINRLRRNSVIDATDRYASLFLETITDPQTGEVTFKDKSGQVQKTVGAAWDAYAVKAGANASAAGFREFLATSADHAAAREYLNGLNSIFRNVAVMGVTPAELRNSLDGVLVTIKPASMTQPQLEATIAAGVI